MGGSPAIERRSRYASPKKQKAQSFDSNNRGLTPIVLDYLINQTQDAVVLNGAGIPVKVPDPARFALHKLAVSQLRPVGEKTKSDKDIRQAEQLLEVLLADNPGSAMLAADAVNEREDPLGNLILKGASRLPPEMREPLCGWVHEKVWDAELGKAILGKPQER